MMLKKAAAAIVLLLCSSLAQSQVAQLSATEIEKRNAAVAFALGREGSLYTLLGECSHLMSLSNLTVETIAKGWFDRNKPELEAACCTDSGRA